MNNKPIREVATIQAGYPFRGSIPEVPDGPVRVVQMRDMSFDAGIEWMQVMKTSYPKGRSNLVLASGDILFLARGDKFIAQALTDVPADTICSPHFFVIRPRDNKELMPEFLAWQINQAQFQQHLNNVAEGSGQLSIRRPILENLMVAVPKIDRQRRILRLADLVRRERLVMSQLMANRQKQLQVLVSRLLTGEQLEEGL